MANDKSRADALTDEQIDAIAQDFLILGDGDTEHDSIDWRGFARAVRAASPVEQHEAAPAASNAERHSWIDENVTGNPVLIQAMKNIATDHQAAPLEGTGNGAKTCKTCGGSRVVDDGEITGEGRLKSENGPIRCVKDCPDCHGGGPEGWRCICARRAAGCY